VTGEFSLWLFLPNGEYWPEARFVDARTAIRDACAFSQSPSAKLGVVREIMVTDGDDFCVFLWEYGLGVTFPPRSSVTGRFVSEDDPHAVAIGQFAKSRLPKHPRDDQGWSPAQPGRGRRPS